MNKGINAGWDQVDYLKGQVELLDKRIAELEAALAQVDDVLIVNWITAEEGNYRKALHDLVQFNIQIENDPAVSETARVRTNEIAKLKRELAEERARLNWLAEDYDPDVNGENPPDSIMRAIMFGDPVQLRAAIDAARKKL